MLTNEQKRQIREYYDIKNITVNKKRDGFTDVNMYYEDLFLQMKTDEVVKRELALRKQRELELKEKEAKKKLKNKLKKLRKRMNKKVKEFSDSDSNDADDETEQIKPYVFFSPHLQSQFNDNLYLIEMLNQYFDANENYKKFLLENDYEKINITKALHKGFTDENHFNGYFYSGNDEITSTCIYFYVQNEAITKLSKIVEIF